MSPRRPQGRARPEEPNGDGNVLPSGRHKLSRDHVVESQRQRIFDALAQLCAEQGYVTTSVADIVERARVSRATFYQLFRDKEDCCVAAIEAHLRRLMVKVSPAYSQAAPWPVRVQASIEALLEFIIAEPDYAKLSMIEALAAGDRAYETYSVGWRLLTSMMDEGRERFAGDWMLPSTAGRAVLGAAELLIISELAGGRADRLQLLLPDILYCILVPYLGAEEALRYAAAAASGLRAQSAPQSAID